MTQMVRGTRRRGKVPLRPARARPAGFRLRSPEKFGVIVGDLSAPRKGMADLIGLEHGNFILTRKLGEGGMGTVYLAEHRWIGRKKAVKILHEEAARSAELVRRFFDEAMAASACQHEHIVDIEDCGTLQAG